MSRLLVAESFILLRPVLEKLLRDAGHEVELADSSREVVTALCDHDHDALIIDLDMAKCGGLSTVRYVRRLEAGRELKVLGLTNHGDREFIIQSLNAGVSSLLLKEQCTPQAMTERLAQLLAAPAPAQNPPAAHEAQDRQVVEPTSPACAKPSAQSTSKAVETPAAEPAEVLEPPAPLSQAAIDAVIPRMLEGKAMRPIAHKVIAMTGNPNIDMQTVAQVVRSDMELSAKVIAAASSAFYRRRNVSVRNLTDAIGVIGLNGTRSLAMSLSVVDHFGPNCDDPLLAMPGLWGHSLSVAHLAETLAKATRACDPDQAFVVGLLHDLGRMLMAEHLPEHYRHVVHSDPSTNLNLHEIERRIVGADHALFGGVVTERWGCPSFISRGVKLHHSQSIQTDEGVDALGGLLRILLLADSMAIAFGFAGDTLEELSSVPRGWLNKTIEDPAEFRDRSLDTLREAQALVMSRSNLTIDLPTPWNGDFEQILVLGTVVQPLEPLQLLLSHAFHDAPLAAPARVDRGVQKTLVLADLRGVGKTNDTASLLNWLNREKAPQNWPVLVVSRLGAEQIDQLGLTGRRVALARPPLRPVLIRAAVASLGSSTGGFYGMAA